MVDRVHPLKLESTPDGGDELDPFPSSLNKNEDYVDSRGITVQDNTSNDEAVIISRNGDGDMTFKDVANPTEVTLTELLSGEGGLTEEGHKVLRHLIHFIDDGPADGFTSGAYKEITGTVFPTAIVWWESSAKIKKIVEKAITWIGAFPQTIEWKMYSADGNLLATVTDTLTYSGPFETNRTRAIVVP